MTNQATIDIQKTTAYICDCGSSTFEQFFFIRVLPMLFSPTGKKELVPLQAFRCTECQKVADLANLK